MAKFYLFSKTVDGQTVFVCGPSVKNETPAGAFRQIWSENDTKLKISFIDSREPVFNEFGPDPLPVTSYYKENGTAYADAAELIAAVRGFFFNVVGGTNVFVGFETVQITGDGVNTDYAMPVDCNIAAPFIINSDIYSAELVLVSGVKKIRFSDVLTDEQFPVVAYTPTVATDPTTRKKQYTAYWTQTGTNAQVAVEQENDIEPVLARSSAGVYTATKAGAFVEGKTVPISESYIDAETGNKMKMVRTSADVMTITTYLAADLETPADGVLTNQYIHFEIFN